MKQEDYNSMMSYPWERDYEEKNESLPFCPSCGETYLGDGIEVCVDCEKS